MSLGEAHKFVRRISSQFLADFAVQSFVSTFLRVLDRQTDIFQTWSIVSFQLFAVFFSGPPAQD